MAGSVGRAIALQATDGKALRSAGRRIVGWYKLNARDLPWRRQPTPYSALVSEVMLQQTVVAAVIPYFRRWMRRFPNVRALADADEQEVLALWEGLGYYRRASNLLAGARLMASRHGGRVPREREALLALPGVGPYIAAAVRSFAFGEDEVAMDANVVRVFMRLLALGGTAAEGGVRSAVQQAALTAMPRGRSALFNQGLMDFGSVVCRPRWPLCPACLLRARCQAFGEGLQHDIPRRSPRLLRKGRAAVAVFIRDGAAYVQRRPPDGRFAGLWEFPGGKVEGGETPRRALRRECREELGVSTGSIRKLLSLTHRYTVFEVRLHAFLCSPPEGLPADATHRWVPLAELDRYPMPSASRRLVKHLEVVCGGTTPRGRPGQRARRR